MIALVLVGCVGKSPFVDEPPVLLYVNDLPVDPDRKGKTVGVVTTEPPPPGVPVHLVIDAEDPERDGFQVLFPFAAGEVRFDPDAREGDWIPPDEIPAEILDVYLLDDHDPPAGQMYQLLFGASGSGR